MRKYVNEKNCKLVVSSLIISHIDYFNALYYSLPDCLKKHTRIKSILR